MTARRRPAPGCAACGSARLFGPGPMRTGAHPNSSALLVEAPGSRFHDFTVQGTVCLDCGQVALSLSPTTLDALRRVVDGFAGDAAPPRSRTGQRRRRRP